jgi:hypothetical protein
MKQQFEAIFEVPTILSNGREATTLYLKPKTMDATKYESILYSGKGSDESNFLAQYSRREENFTEEAFTKEQSEFLEIKKKRRPS